MLPRISSDCGAPIVRKDLPLVRFAFLYEDLKIKKILFRKAMSFILLAVSNVSFSDSTTHGPAIKKRLLLFFKLKDLLFIFTMISFPTGLVPISKIKD
jgi:hypothetical protein